MVFPVSVRVGFGICAQPSLNIVDIYFYGFRYRSCKVFKHQYGGGTYRYNSMAFVERASSTEEKPSEGQSGSPSASLTKKSTVSGVISALIVLKFSEFSGEGNSSLGFELETPKTAPFSPPVMSPSARQVRVDGLRVESGGGCLGSA
ncbi:hypothetical protein Hanom_Chr01g00025021 [Helianthus anomalus]